MIGPLAEDNKKVAIQKDPEALALCVGGADDCG
jgi:hypothetical protein